MFHGTANSSWLTRTIRFLLVADLVIALIRVLHRRRALEARVYGPQIDDVLALPGARSQRSGGNEMRSTT